MGAITRFRRRRKLAEREFAVSMMALQTPIARLKSEADTSGDVLNMWSS